MTQSPGKSPVWICLIVISVSVFAIYGQSLKFGFVNYDDDELIYNNGAFLSDWKNIKTAFVSHAFIGAGGESIYYRPLFVVTLILDYHLWRLNPFGYHLTNLILHTLTAFLVFLLLDVLLRNGLTALFGALIFSLHPVQTESVGWIAGRNDVLLGFFILLAILFYAMSQEEIPRKKTFSVLTVISFTLAVFTKESALFYSLLFPAYDMCIKGKTAGEIFSVKNLRRYWATGGVIVGYFIVRWFIFGALIGAEKMYGGGKPFLNRLALMPGIFAENLRLIVCPINLSAAHPPTDIVWLAQPWYAISVIVPALLILSLFYSFRKNKIICFGLLWLIAGLVPTLNIIPMPKPILEHRLYVPLAGLGIAAVHGIDRFSHRFLQDRYRTIFFTSVAIILAMMSYARLPVWENGITLFSDAVRKSPSDLHSNYSLARAYYNAGLYDESRTALHNYLKLAPDDLRGYRFLREIHYVTGRYSEVASVCKKMIELDPHNSLRFLETGVIYEQLNRFDTAAAYYRQGSDLDPSNAEIHYRTGVVSEKLNDHASAEMSYRSAIGADSLYINAYTRLAKLYAARNASASARHLLENGLRLIEPSPEYLKILAEIYISEGDTGSVRTLEQRYNLRQ